MRFFSQMCSINQVILNILNESIGSSTGVIWLTRVIKYMVRRNKCPRVMVPHAVYGMLAVRLYTHGEVWAKNCAVSNILCGGFGVDHRHLDLRNQASLFSSFSSSPSLFLSKRTSLIIIYVYGCYGDRKLIGLF